MEELFSKDGKLIPEDEWVEIINNLEQQTKPSTKDQLQKTINDAIEKRLPKEKFGLLLSGGVDSSFLALAFAKVDVVAITVGLEGSPDLEFAKKLAKHLNLTHIEKVLTLDELETIILEVMKITKKDDIITIGVGAVEYAGLQIAQQHNLKIIFGGLGAEEIFAGYQRHEQAEDINKECWNGLMNMHSRDLERDYAIFSHFNIEARTPFLDRELIISAMGIDAKKKMNKEYKKVILREIAEEQGLPEEFAWRKKKAAQYGSNIIKAIEKLAKRKNFKFKKEYLAAVSSTLV